MGRASYVLMKVPMCLPFVLKAIGMLQDSVSPSRVEAKRLYQDLLPITLRLHGRRLGALQLKLTRCIHGWKILEDKCNCQR